MGDERGGAVDLRNLGGEEANDPGSMGGGAADAGAPVRDPEAIPHAGTLAARTGSEIAAEAGALGDADGSLADAAGMPGGTPGRPTTSGEALGAGAGRGEPGAGTPGDHGGLGGGDPLMPPNGG